MRGVSERARSAQQPPQRCLYWAPNERDKARMTFHQSGDVTVVGAADQIALPMTGNGAVFDLSRPFSDGDGVDDLTAVISAITGVPRATDTPRGSQVPDQLFFQHSAGLNE